MSFSKAKLIRFNDIQTGNTGSTVINNFPKTKTKKICYKTNTLDVDAQSCSSSDSKSIKSVPASFKIPLLPKTQKKTKVPTKPLTKSVSTDVNSTDLEALKEKTVECENKTKYIHELSGEIESLKKELKKFENEVEKLQKEYRAEIQDYEFEMLKLMTQIQECEDANAKKNIEMQKCIQLQKEKLEQEYKLKVDQNKLENEKELMAAFDRRHLFVSNDELKAKEEQYKAEIQSLQNNFNEKNIQYDELKRKYEELVKNHQLLLEEQTASTAKLKNKTDEFSLEIEQKTIEIDKLNDDLKKYQLTVNNCEIIIDILKKRLLDSDKDVEQLKEELSSYEEKLIDYEQKLLHLTNELQNSNEVCNKFQSQYELLVKMCEDSINAVKCDLLNKVNKYKSEVYKYIQRANEDDVIRMQLMHQIDCNNDLYKQLYQKIEHSECQYVKKIQKLDKKIANYEANQQSYVNQIDNLVAERNIKKRVMEEKTANIILLENNMKELQNKNAALQNELDYYNIKMKAFEYDSSETTDARRKYIDLSGKYDVLIQDYEILHAENLDYKNQVAYLNKKIKQLTGIEEKYEQLMLDQTLDNENVPLKVKHEDQKVKKYLLASTKSKDNITSPNRSLLDSPNQKSAIRSPFREIN